MGGVIDPARLAAYVDGALEPEEAASVVMHLADTPADRRRVEQLAELNALLVAAYAAPLAEPIPERIRRIVEPSAVVPLRARRAVLPTAAIIFAAAASVVLVTGLTGNRDLPPLTGAPGVGPVQAGSELHAALETSPSGMGLSFPDGDEVTLIATFLDGQGRPCREFELLHEADSAFSRGIACRSGEGDWAIAVVVSEPSLAAADAGPGYVPAAGTVDAALSGALDVLGAGAGLTPEAERALIAAGWAVP